VTIDVYNEKSGSGVQTPGLNPQQQNSKRRLTIIVDIFTTIGYLFFMVCGLIRLYMNISFDS